MIHEDSDSDGSDIEECDNKGLQENDLGTGSS